ncbi:MAG: hypothetical protein M3318_07030 [Actinomycetota bacterium]|nr:hypothetical protein [Actinomycetota bacterium]
MGTYTPTAADRLPLPASWSTEPRYLGYREDDHRKPYAKYFKPDTLPVQDHVREALLAGMAPTEWGYDLDDAARMLERPGYHKMETGWTRMENGTTVISVLTRMAGVTADMWDWWMSWHSVETARYKLWYPDAHQFAALADDRSADRSLTYRQRYRENVSFVDEYIGGTLSRLAIRFVDPARLGFTEKPGYTVIAGLGTSPLAPVSTGWVVHQVRPTDDGCEMRSRFWIRPGELLDLPASSMADRPGARLLTNKAVRPLAKPLLPRVAPRLLPASFGYDLLFHCASEMNHLASFLPDLYAEFKDTP